MVCPRCGSELPEKAKFCHECGSQVSSESTAEGASLGGLRTLAVPPAEPSPAGDPDAEGIDVSFGGLKTMSGPGGGPVGSAGAGVPLSDRYELLEELGRGGFAAVHLGRDRKLDRPVAVKRLLPAALAGPEAARTAERFEREARAIASLNHRNVVAVYDTDRDAEGRYIVMEYVDGGTLRDYLKERGPLPVPEASSLMVAVCKGLAAAHLKGIVHRDVKPANILLAREGGERVPKLTDFGLARAGGGSDVSMTGYGMGTPFYMAPEQRRDAKSVNHTVDVYSAGKTLYELVTGQMPENVDPGEIPPPPELSEIIFRCIRTKPEERYFSMEDLVRDLEALADPAKAAPGRKQSAGANLANPCPQCGSENPVSSLFCVSCGAGMSRDCPECGTKNSVNLKYCGQCGTDVESFAAYSEALARMTEHVAKKRWSRVVKELAALPAEPRLAGERGAKLLAETEALGRQANEALARIAELEAEIAKAVDGQRFAEALEKMAAHAELAPDDEAMAELRIQAEDARLLVELGRLRDTARGHAERREYSELLVAVAPVAELVGQVDSPEEPNPLFRGPEGEPSTKTVASMVKDIDSRLAAARDAGERADALLASASVALEEGRHEAARSILEEAEDVYPGRADVRDAAGQAESKQVEERKALTELGSLVDRLDSHLGTKALAEAREALAHAEHVAGGLSLHPDQSSHGEWQELCNRLSVLRADLEGRENRVAELLASAKGDMAEGRLERSLNSLRQAHDIHPAHEACGKAIDDVAKLISEERADVELLRTHAERLESLLEERSLHEAEKLADVADKLAASRSIAPEESLHSEWEALCSRLDALRSELVERTGGVADLIAGFRQSLAERRLSQAEAAMRRIDEAHPGRVDMEGLRSLLGVFRRRRARRRAALVLVALVPLAALGALAAREIRFRWRVAVFDSAAEGGRRDEATRLAELVCERHLPAREWLYGRAMEAGREALANRNWAEAERQFSVALAVPGHEEDEEALSSQYTARIEGRVALAHRANEAGRWADVVFAADEILALDAGHLEALALRREGEAHLPVAGRDWTVPEIGMEFVWIEALSQWVGKYEVTNGEYHRKDPQHDSKAYGNHSLNGDRQPVVYVNWDDAVSYAAWLTERERAASRLPTGMYYRLPTEKEFMTYAQCGNGREYPWGNNWPPRTRQAGNYSGQESAWRGKIDGYHDGHPVACDVEKSWANPWGLYGVGGNVWECCAKDASMSQAFGAWRGASWDVSSQLPLRCTYRDVFSASCRYYVFGFRLVLALDAGNRDALALKREGEEDLFPAWRLVATVDGRETPATITLGGRAFQSPHTFTLENGRSYTAEFSYEANDRTYRAESVSVTADWKGERELRIELEEFWEPAPGRNATVEGLGLELVWVAPGSFQMGCNDGDYDEKPVQEVHISRGFWLGRHEATQAEYEAVMGTNPSRFKGSRNPVEQVPWNDATEFCRRLSERERAAGRLPAGYEYRLPTEAEWEYAARGGSQSRGFTYAGSNSVGEVAWYDSNSGMTHPVGGRKPNELGLHDMSGNVWEWCHDWYQDSYSGLSHTDPEGPGSGSDRVGRGGSWFNAAVFCRLAYRSRLAPAITFDRIGFRVALAAPLQPVTASVPVAAPPDVVAGDGGATPGAVAVPETGKDWTVPEIGMEFVWIRQLNLWVGKYEVTNGEYRRKEPRHDSKAFENHTLNGDRQPVVEVNWDDAVAYAAWLTERERAAGRLPAGMRYRLPTENEFLAYAQCGDGREYPWGSHWPPRNGQAGNYSGQESAWRDRVLGYNDGHPVTCNVEESWTNPWGLYGVGGNVWEICARDAVPGQSFGAWRGASWRDSIRSYAECFLRFDCVASNQCEGNGFRVVLSR